MRSRQAATAPANRRSPSSASEVACSGQWTITSCAPSAGCEANRLGSDARVDARSGSIELASPVSACAALCLVSAACPVSASAVRCPSPRCLLAARYCLVPGSSTEHGIQIRHRALRPTRRIALPAARALRPDLGGRSTLASLAERAGLRRLPARSSRRRSERVRTVCPARREDRAQARELVYPYLGEAQGASGAARRSPPPSLAPASRNGFTMSSGSGKTIVELWLTPMSSSVWR